MGSKDPCAAVTPRRNVRERIGHVCPTAFRHADPTRFADWIPGPIPWPITADRLADGARVELARDFRPNSLSRTAPLPHGPPSHAGVFSTGHTGQTSINPSWERFSCGVRGVGRIRTSGGLRPCCFRDSRIRPLCHYSTDPHEGTNWLTYSCGSRAPGGIRTHDRTIRSRLL